MSLKFIAGLALGAIVVHFLNTEEGKAFICRLKTDINKAEDGLTDLAEGLVQKGKEFINGKPETEELEAPLIVVVESNPVV
ncbi:hypothetical protein GWC95_08520 [Sediminibacterium roseum]|uniref:YtxH-like protein n=1 Tax=Sediminibacterium roseum TaxID=1978412 RepID=A0ABW9ZVC8_9BACT|nr:hypothetical protein [Sediminibacterium roseum]NCI49963.1 hypothetical protein [Sediminibacterium roseum]